MIDKKELKKALILHDVTVQMIAEAAQVSESTVYRWLKNPEKLNIGTVEMLKEVAKFDRDEFTRIFYPETVA